MSTPRVNLAHFYHDSVGEAFAAAKAAATIHSNSWREAGPSRNFIKRTVADADKCLTHGCVEHLAECERLADKWGFSLDAPTAAFEWQPGVVGALPSIPDYLVGSPESMRRRVPTLSNAGPIKVAVSLFYSCSFSPEQILTRGAAAMALVLSLSRLRPVELLCGVIGTGRGATDPTASALINLGTTPLDMGAISYALCDSDFCRRMAFVQPSEALGDSNFYSTKDADYNRRLWGLEENDVYLPCLTGFGQDRSISHPQEWIQETLDRVNGTGL